MTADSYQWEPFAESGDLAIRRMRDDDLDYHCMARWLIDERVLQFYEGRDNPYTIGKVRDRYGPRTQGEAGVISCIMIYKGSPIGYMQYYQVLDGIPYGVNATRGDYGVDLFIGEPDVWDQGIGTHALSMLLDYLFAEMRGKRILIDPLVTNHRAIRCYEKCGFTKLKLLPKHELHEGAYRDAWLMVIERAD